MNTKRTLGLLFCLSITVFKSGFAEDSPAPVLNPRTYVSPSGVYMLMVDPTDLYGRGPADYRFTKDGKTIWANRLPYSLWEAVVTDLGQVAGYAYTHGWRGFSEEGWDDGPGKFIVAVLSAEGKTLKEERHIREWSHFLHTPPNPLADGPVLDTSSKRFVIGLGASLTTGNRSTSRITTPYTLSTRITVASVLSGCHRMVPRILGQGLS
jgi:hypothetical protein